MKPTRDQCDHQFNVPVSVSDQRPTHYACSRCLTLSPSAPIRPRLLDLCSCAGIGAGGYVDAGFEVVCVDVSPQPNNPYEFVQADALSIEWGRVDVIHASPPCQLHTRAGKLRDAQGGTSRYENLLSPTLAILRNAPVPIPWVVENVPDAKPLMVPQEGETLTMLCGSMFGLAVQRHRLFLSSVPLSAPGPCVHSTFERDPITGKPRPWGVFHVPNDDIPKGGRTARDLAHGKEVMGVPADRACTWNELKEAIPPAYTKFLGEQLLEHLKVAA